MALIKCKECGADISSKAESCPQCGFRLKKKSGGCVVGLFKAVGGLVGGVIALVVVTSFMMGSETTTQPQRDYVGELERRCKEEAARFPMDSGRANFYTNCVEAGKAALRSRGINVSE
jgi:hypothetical protein